MTTNQKAIVELSHAEILALLQGAGYHDREIEQARKVRKSSNYSSAHVTAFRRAYRKLSDARDNTFNTYVAS